MSAPRRLSNCTPRVEIPDSSFKMDLKPDFYKEHDVDITTDPKTLIEIINLQGAQIRCLLNLLEEAEERIANFEFKLKHYSESSPEATAIELKNEGDHFEAVAVKEEEDAAVEYENNAVEYDYELKIPIEVESHATPVTCVNIYECSNCTASFKKRHKIVNHLKECGIKETDDVPREKISKSRRKFWRKSVGASANVRYNCTLCALTFKHERALAAHFTVHSRPYVCDKCERTFANETSLKIHKANRHGGAKLFHCDRCGKSYATLRLLKRHLVNSHTVLNEEKLERQKCGECGFRFRHLSSLKTHLILHSGVKKHQCDNCGKAFVTSSALNLHMTSHSDLRPHKCNICERSFKKVEHLKRHFVSHTNQRSHRCETCSKAFKSPEHLRGHLKVHKEPAIPCLVCPRVFRTRALLGQHMLFHNGHRNFCCEHCQKRFYTKSNLKEHIRLHLGLKDYHCDSCQRTFTLLSNMKKHKAHCRNAYNKTPKDG